MPYIRETITAGTVVEVREYYTARYNQKGGSRASHREETADAQVLVNYRNAERKLRGLLRMNFTDNDWLLTLRFKNGYRITHEECHEAAKKFVRLMRREYAKCGQDFRYIYVIEHLKRTCHIHIVLPSTWDIKPLTIRKTWDKVSNKTLSVFFVPTYPAKGEFAIGLASYMLKEFDPKNPENKDKEDSEDDENEEEQRKTPKGGKWFFCSRNLRQPEVVKEIMKRTKIPKEPFIKKGYLLLPDTLYTGVCAFTGLEYRSYAMIRGGSPPSKLDKKKKPKRKTVSKT